LCKALNQGNSGVRSVLFAGFNGESTSLKDKQTDIIKDHLFGNQSPHLEQIILLIRNPYSAIVAEFHRDTSNSHYGIATKKQFDAGDTHVHFLCMLIKTFERFL